MFTIQEARNSNDFDAARELFVEYAAWLNVDLCFQSFDEELRTLPGVYRRPEGFVLLALVDDGVAGCIALKPREGGACEMKRLYVRPQFQGFGIGRALAEACLSEAAAIGYDRMVLDTFERMTPAVTLYRSLGFAECEGYYENPHDGVVYMEKALPAG
jgi:ribosomal protein S18 acetylase RimI-like enzyme